MSSSVKFQVPLILAINTKQLKFAGCWNHVPHLEILDVLRFANTLSKSFFQRHAGVPWKVLSGCLQTSFS
jgi:hypothetical protein